MIHPDTRLEWIDDQIGYGVVATRPIPRGTILWTLDPLDQRLGPQQLANLGEAWMPVLAHYSYTNASGYRILCWDLARYMNHHCEPASLSPGTNFELAVRDLEPGDAVTCDYSSLNLESDLVCSCGSPRCRGVIRAADGERLAAKWDAKLRVAIRDTVRVPQPLWPYVEEREAIPRWARRPRSLPSSRCHLLRPDELHRRLGEMTCPRPDRPEAAPVDLGDVAWSP